MKQKIKYTLVWIFGAAYASSLWMSFTVDLTDTSLSVPLVAAMLFVDLVGSTVAIVWLLYFFGSAWSIDTKEDEEDDDDGNKDKKVERKSGATHQSKVR